MAKGKKIETAIDLEKGTLRIATVGANAFTCNVLKLSGMAEIWPTMSELQRQVFMHGVKQKVCDSASALKGAEAEDAMRETWGNLLAGDWSSKGGVSSTSIAAQAYAATTGKTPEKAAEALAKMDEKEIKKVKAGAAFKVEMAKINLARATKALEAEKKAA